MNYQKMSKTSLVEKCRQMEKHMRRVRVELWLSLWAENITSIRTERQLGISQAIRVMRDGIRPFLFFENFHNIYARREILEKNLQKLFKETNNQKEN